MANLCKIFNAAGLQDGWIKDTGGTRYDVYAIINSTGDVSVDEVEIKGDDSRLATYIFNRYEEISLEANGVNFDVIAAITSNTVGNNVNSTYIPLGTNEEDNPPFVEVGGMSTARCSDGDEVIVEKTWHRVQITNVKITQAGETEFKLEMTGIAVKTSTDIVGATFADGMGERIATLLLRSA